VRFFLAFLVWASATFAVSWAIATPYQHALAGVAGGLAAPRGSEIEWVDLQLFFPFDLGVFVALCLATSWATWRERGRAIALGLPILIVLELIALVFAMKAMLGTLAPGTPPARVEEVQRWALGIIRVTGLVAAGAVWMVFLGQERVLSALATPVDRTSQRRRRNA
jgi:hypothetical protein